MTIKIRKRQGYLVNYDREQLYHSISPVIPTQKEQAQVVCYCDSKIKALDGIKQHLSIEELLDLVQNSLAELNFKDEAAKFAAYREERKRVREAKKIKVDVESTIEDYVGQLDWRVNENANQGYSVGGMILNTSGKVTANYWLSSVYPERVGQAHRDGRIHIHDLSFLGCYCCGWDLKRLLDEGLNGLKGHIDSKPPKNLSGAVGQMVNALGVLQNEAAGAQAYSSADTYLAPFVRELRKKIESEYRDVIGMTGGAVDANADRLKAYVDEKLHKEVYQCIQELIFNLNVPSRWGCVPLDTEVLTPNGWKHYDELQKNDEIFSYNTDTKTIELDRVKAIVKKKNTSGVLHCYINEKKGYEQCVTPEHRVIHKKLGSSEYQISKSEELWNAAVRQAAKLDKKTVGLVNFANGFNNDNDGLTDEEVMLAAFLYTDGMFDWRKSKTVIHKVIWIKSSKRWGRKEFKECSRKLGLDWKHSHKSSVRRINGVEWTCDMHSYRCYGDSARKIVDLIGHKTSIHERFFRMNARHAKLFLDTWRKTDGCGMSLQCDSELIASQIQHIAMLAGYRSAITKGTSFRVKLKRKSVAVYPTKVQEIEYSGDVWCPSVVKNGTAIFRRNGKTFISGQSQTPFTNLTFDLTCPEDLKDRKPKIGGVEVEDYTYGDLQEEMNLLNNVFVEVYMKGDAKSQPFTFPIPTYNITRDFDWNSKFVDSVFEMAAKYGLPYFQNFMSSDMKPSDVRSMCCRLRLDKRELLKRGNGLFGSAEQTGSIGVVTINLARLGYKHKGDLEGLYKELDELLIIAKDSLEIKRAIVSKLLDQGFYPALSRYLSHFNNHFSTIGINGGNEMIRNFTNDEEDISTDYGQKMMLDMMDYLRQRMADFQEETGNLYNVEAAPCEGCFAGDTLVQTYEGNIAIKELVGKKDLLVYTRNNKTKKVELKKARAYQTSKKAEVLEIEFDKGQKIVCTPQHPIARNHWNGRRGTEIEWVPAELLQPGMSIESNDASLSARVVAIRRLSKKIPVYNIEVQDNHNYFVGGAQGILVHNCMYRFALADKKAFGDDIIQAGPKEAPYYTNSSQLPVSFTDDIFEALDLQNDLQCKYTGGTVLHLYMAERVSSTDVAKTLVKKIFENYTLPYITFTPTFSICPIHGYLAGEHEYCPICDAEIEKRAKSCCNCETEKTI